MFASNVYTISACAWHSRIQCWKKREKNMVVVYWYKFVLKILLTFYQSMSTTQFSDWGTNPDIVKSRWLINSTGKKKISQN